LNVFGTGKPLVFKGFGHKSAMIGHEERKKSGLMDRESGFSAHHHMQTVGLPK
jgi:hypothetical protein